MNNSTIDNELNINKDDEERRIIAADFLISKGA